MIRLLILAFALVANGASARAACTGKDLLAELRAADPAGIAAVFEKAHALPNARGLFWRVERTGLRASYLFGTFHSPDAVQYVPEATWRALDSADVAVFELSLDEQAALEQRTSTDPTFIFDPDAPPLSSLIDASTRTRLAEALEARDLPVEVAEQMRSWMLATLLGFPACQLEALAAGARPLDYVMAHRADDRGIAVAGLESYEQSLASLSALDRPTLIAALMATTGDPGIEEDVFRTLSELYAAGEVAAINELSIWLAERAAPGLDVRRINARLMVDVLDRRNQNWMEPLTARLGQGNAFVAVGALHLPGSHGLVELLRQRGYTVTRLD